MVDLQSARRKNEIQMECWQKYFSGRMIFYSAQSLVLGCFLSFYGIEGFKNRNPCFGDGLQYTNVSKSMAVVFETCFYVHLSQFITSTIAGPLVDVLIPLRNSRQGQDYQTIMKNAK